MLVFLFALLLAPAARATLAVAVPSRDGLVIAADSRLTFMGAECDGASKILIPARPVRTVAVVTGDGVFVAPAPRGEDPCRYLANAPRLLDMDAVLTQYLDHAGNNPARIDLAALADACVQAVERFRAAHPEALRNYAGRVIFSVLAASYEPGRSTTILRNFVVRIDDRTGRAEAARMSTTAIGARDPSGVWIYGETDWVTRNLYAGAGRTYLSPATLEFLRNRRPVGGTSLESAAAVAADLLNAASRAAKIDPPPSAIGGVLRVVVVGRKPRPEGLSGAVRRGAGSPGR